MDALGTPIDGAGPIKTTTRRRVELKVRWVGEWSQAGRVEGLHVHLLFCKISWFDKHFCKTEIFAGRCGIQYFWENKQTMTFTISVKARELSKLWFVSGFFSPQTYQLPLFLRVFLQAEILHQHHFAPPVFDDRPVKASWRVLKRKVYTYRDYTGILLMEQPVEVGSLYHYSQGFLHPRWYFFHQLFFL